MSVKKEGNAWYMRFQVRGRRIHEPTHATTKAAALKREAERRLELERGDDIRAGRVPTLAQFAPHFEQYLDQTQNLKPNTIRSYKNGLRLLRTTDIVHRRLNDIWPTDVDTLTFPGGGSNANQAIRTLHRMLSFAVEKKYLQSVPSIKLRKENKRKAIIEAWLESLMLELAAPVLRDFIVIMLDCGMRPDEITRLQWEDILWNDRAVHVGRGKTINAERFVPLSARMDALLRRRKAEQTTPSEWVFPSRNGRHIVPTTPSGYLWRAMLEAARVEATKRGLPAIPEGLVLYSCRHTFASRFLKASGNDRAALKAILGHSSFAVSERYVHPGLADAAKTVDAMNATAGKVRQMGKRA